MGLTFDLARYLLHRLVHRVDLRWRFHGWHHANLLFDTARGLGWLWDRLFGTEITEAAEPERFGLPEDEALAQGALAWQLLRRRG